MKILTDIPYVLIPVQSSLSLNKIIRWSQLFLLQLSSTKVVRNKQSQLKKTKFNARIECFVYSCTFYHKHFKIKNFFKKKALLETFWKECDGMAGGGDKPLSRKLFDLLRFLRLRFWAPVFWADLLVLFRTGVDPAVVLCDAVLWCGNESCGLAQWFNISGNMVENDCIEFHILYWYNHMCSWSVYSRKFLYCLSDTLGCDGLSIVSIFQRLVDWEL